MSVYEGVLVIGGKGGKPFDLKGGTNGKVLEKIGVWSVDFTIKALKVWLTGDEPKMFGESAGTYKEFSFNPGERITRMSLWGNGAGTRTGWIYFETNQGRSFDHGMTEWGRKQEYPVDVGSGVCVGVMGRSGADIDSLGFVFLNPIRSAVLRNVRYPTLAFDAQGIAPETIDVFSDQNTGKAQRNWRFAGKRTVSTTSSWSVTVGLELYSEVSVEASVPGVAKVSGKTGWKLSTSATHSRSETVARELSWEESGTLKPGKSIYLQALSRRGQISLPYQGDFEVVLENGEKFTFPVKGDYKGLTYSGIEISQTDAATLKKFRKSAVA